MEIDHFLHEHTLKLCEKKQEDTLRCSICCDGISDETYACEGGCDFLLHKSCAELPRAIQHFFHPCTLYLGPHLGKVSSTCNACFKNHKCWDYHCEKCNFNLDLECAARNLTVGSADENDEQIQHFCHWDPLTKSPGNKGVCVVCQGSTTGTMFGCSKCKFYIHKSCMEILPRKVQHLFHPCPLILNTVTNKNTRCCSCKKHLKLDFRCGVCLFSLDIKCALLPTLKIDEYKRMRANWHDHTLLLSETTEYEKNCQACKGSCLGSTYCCNSCNFFLHKQGFELPQGIQSRFDLKHPLHLIDFATANYKRDKSCSLCFRVCSSIAFACRSCAIYLHIQCASVSPTVKYQGHKHLLYIVEKFRGKLTCHACKSSIKKDSPGFCCVTCKFNLHLLCGPLPLTIKHRRHVDPLRLKNFYIEDNEDDDNEIYCDACENRRNPRESVYYCPQGCPFISEIGCVISEVIASLKGERGNVKLRSIFGLFEDHKENGLVMNALDLGYDAKEEQLENELCPFNLSPVRLTHKEREELEILGATAKEKMRESIPISQQDDEKQKDKFTPSSEQDFIQFQNRLYHEVRKRLQRYYCKYEQSFASISDQYKGSLEGYMRSEGFRGQNFSLPRILVPIYEVLFPKYEAITADSNLSPNVKLVLFTDLCAVVFGMNMTAIVDITQEKLVDWRALLRFVECGGFNVKFIWDHLQQVSRAYFGLYATNLAEDTVRKQEREIEQITNEIKNLEMRLQAKKEEHEEYKLFVQSARTSSYMKQCLDDFSTRKWQPATAGLFG